MNKLLMSLGYDKYFEGLTSLVNQLYSIAKEARSKGLDQTLEPEPELTYDIAERIEKLIGPEPN